MSVWTSKARSYLIKVLDRATPFTGMKEVAADFAGPFVVDQFGKHVIERYVEEGYQDEVNRFVEALDNEDLVAAEVELKFFAQGVVTLPFFKSDVAGKTFIEGMTKMMLAAVQEIQWRLDHKEEGEVVI